MTLRWRGTDRSGRARTGAVTDRTPAAFALECYVRGFRSLEVTRQGQSVAGISQNPHTRRRLWWGEQA